jgi:hypothetical protein
VTRSLFLLGEGRLPERRDAVDDSARLFWLRRYTNEEIATMAAAVSGREPDLEPHRFGATTARGGAGLTASIKAVSA